MNETSLALTVGNDDVVVMLKVGCCVGVGVWVISHHRVLALVHGTEILEYLNVLFRFDNESHGFADEQILRQALIFQHDVIDWEVDEHWESSHSIMTSSQNASGLVVFEQSDNDWEKVEIIPNMDTIYT